MSRTRQILSGALLLALLMIVTPGLKAQAADPADLAAYFQRLHEELDFSGTVLVADQNGILLHEGYGLANDAAQTPMTADTVLLMGSISKQLTAAAILHLEAAGKLSVDDPVSKFFPGAPSDKAGITLHQLLTHSGGFTSDHFEGDLEPLTKEAALVAIFALDLGFDPGTHTNYSNSGYTLLAAVIEEVSGQTYTSYLRDHFFTPLGMERTGFFNDDWQDIPVANGYWYFRDNGNPAEFFGPYWGIMGNGGIMTTVADLYTWWQALETNDVLPAAQTEKLFTPHIAEDAEETSFYGYGWVITDSALGPVVTHNGGGLGGNADLAVFPDEGLIVIIMSNRIGGRLMGGVVPLELRFPATEAQEQLADNIARGDFSRLPPASTDLRPYLLGLLVVLLVVIVLAVLLVRWWRPAAGE